MFKSENIVVANEKTHCTLKQGGKIIFQFNALIEFTKVCCIFMSCYEL
jgi:hypothetical protein